MNGNCLDIGTIQSFLDCELDHKRAAEVSGHIAACDACAVMLAEAEEESSLVFPALAREMDSMVPTQRLWGKWWPTVMPSSDPQWIEAFMHGFDALATRYDVELIGGDTTRGPRTLCVTAIGELPAGTAITRSGARAGDIVYVSGTLGDAALALAVEAGRVRVEARDRAALEGRLDRPEPRVALGMSLPGIASAALDVSDGLTGDLAHILDASKVGATIDVAAIPCSDVVRALLHSDVRAVALQALLAGGDDYELCFTAPPAMRGRIAALAHTLALPLTPIGIVNAEPGLVARDERGGTLSPLPRAFDHFG